MFRLSNVVAFSGEPPPERSEEGGSAAATPGWAATLPRSDAPSRFAHSPSDRPTLVHAKAIQLLPQFRLLLCHDLRVNCGDRNVHAAEGTVRSDDSAVLVGGATLACSHERAPFLYDVTLLFSCGLLFVRPILRIGGSVPTALLGCSFGRNPSFARRAGRGSGREAAIAPPVPSATIANKNPRPMVIGRPVCPTILEFSGGQPPSAAIPVGQLTTDSQLWKCIYGAAREQMAEDPTHQSGIDETGIAPGLDLHPLDEAIRRP